MMLAHRWAVGRLFAGRRGEFRWLGQLTFLAGAIAGASADEQG